jgi:TonB-dependent receptor
MKMPFYRCSCHAGLLHPTRSVYIGMRKLAMNLLFIGIIVFLVQGTLFSQNVGRISGTVADSLDGTSLVGANVYLMGTAMGAATDREGMFRIIGVPLGTYTIRVSFLGYRTMEMELTLGADDITLHFQLVPDILMGEEVVVTAQARGQMAAINQQITSNTITNVISEEKIKELPDANAAEAIGRLPGVSIMRSGGEANRVVLRGLEDKFVNISIDGVKIPATEEASRGVDLSMISQSFLSGVELYKALTPDMDGDAIAGSIRLVTRKAPETRQIRVDIKGDYNGLMREYDQYISSVYYGERFFNNIVGIQFTGNLEDRIRSNERINIDYGDQTITPPEAYFINDFIVEYTDERRKRDGLSLILDFNTPDDGSIKFSTVYAKTKRDILWSRRHYPVRGGGTQQGHPVYNYRDQEQDIQTLSSSIYGDNRLFGVSLDWGASFAESQAEYPYDYQAIYVEPSGMENPPEVKTNPEQIIPYAVNNFANSSLYWAYYRSQDNYDRDRTAFLNLSKEYLLGGNISGEVKFGGKFNVKDRSNIRNEDFTPYYLGRWQRYELLPDGTIRQKDFTGTHFEEWLASGGGFIGLNAFLHDAPQTRNVYGSYLLNPLVDRARIREWRELNKYGTDISGSQREVWVNPLIKHNDYNVTEQVTAGYIMNTLNLGQFLTLIAGVRIEHEWNDYIATYTPRMLAGFPLAADAIRDTTSSFEQTVWLPNVNISIRPTGFMNLRLAAYKALGRPDFNMRLNRYIAGRPAEVGTSHQVTVGNMNLKTSRSWNFEVNPTFFHRSFGLVSVSAFYKEIEDMYHMLVNFNTVGDTLLQRFGVGWPSQMRTTPYNLTVPYNSPKPTKVWGFEFEHQINFHFLPRPFNNIVLSYNASLVRSETVMYGSETVTYIDSSGVFPLPRSYNKLVERKQKLEGMPEFFGNIVLGYDIGGFSGRISLYHQGKHNYSFSASGYNDQVKNAFTRIDIALKQKVYKYIVVFMNFNNITNIEDSYSIDNRVFDRSLFDQSEKYGFTIDFGITIEL